MSLVPFYLGCLNYIISLMESAYKWMPTGGWLQIALGCGKYPENTMTWWRHQMVAFSALLAICAGNSPVNGEFSAQRPVTRSFDVFFDLRLNKRLSKQSWGWWFETLSCPLWRHCNGRRAPTFLKAYYRTRACLAKMSCGNQRCVLDMGKLLRLLKTRGSITNPCHKLNGSIPKPLLK